MNNDHTLTPLVTVGANGIMKRLILIAAATASLLLPVRSQLLAADAGEEQRQVVVLESNATPQAKDAACARLKRIGTAASVPALAVLLADDQLSHSARFALESMPAPEAGRALTEALDSTKGSTQAGIIISLGNRREIGATPRLAKLVADNDPGVATAAAVALGKIGEPDAVKALKAALPGPTDLMHAALVDGLLRCANRMRSNQDLPGASALFKQLFSAQENDAVRTAAYEGMILSAGKQSLPLLTTGIGGNDPAAQIAALHVAGEVTDPGVVKALTGLLPKSSPAIQIALIGVLSQRGDPAAAPAVLAQAKNQDPAVRLSAITALGILGDGSAIPLLAKASVFADSAEQNAARQALVEIRRGKVSEALIAELASAPPPVQVELVRTLSGRAEKSTVPRLLELARSGGEATGPACLRALAVLADGSDLAFLVQLLRNAKTEAVRSEAQQALSSVCQRAQKKPGFDVGPILAGLSGGSPAERVALLPVCGGLTDARIRTALRSAVKDADPAVRAAGIRALCETRDSELVLDLLALVAPGTEPNLRALALRAYVRLATDEETSALSGPQRADLLRKAFAIASGIEEKKLILAGIANVPASEALALVLPLLEDAGVREEAAQAANQIAGAIRGSAPEATRGALKKVIQVTTDTSRRQAAELILKQMDAAADFITAWQVAGPYFQDGKDVSALFDIPFGPEKAGAAVTWRLMPSGTDPKQPWLLDLLKFLGGDQRVAYARTRVHSETQQQATLELGSDDGVKVWLNDKEVYGNNVARPLTAGSDKVSVTLNRGWNILMLKITQNNQGWEFCARLVKPDGSRLDGLGYDASFAAEAPAGATK